VVHESFHGFPGVEQRHVVVVKDIAVLIARIRVISRLKCIRGVHEIEIQILEAEPVQTCLERGLDALGPMMGVPQLCVNKNVSARDPAGRKAYLQRLAYLALVPVSFGAIEVPESGLQCVSGRTDRYGWIVNEGAEPERGHVARSVFERDCLHPNIRRFDHGHLLGAISRLVASWTSFSKPPGCDEVLTITPEAPR
jgi:hypothetical protein